MLPFRVLQEPKLIIFQVKIFPNILPTQSSLFLAGIKDNDICPLCSFESQLLLHMLLTCNNFHTFWNLFTQWWQKTFQENSESVILWHKKSNNWLKLNYALIIAKYHIFSTRGADSTSNYPQIISIFLL